MPAALFLSAGNSAKAFRNLAVMWEFIRCQGQVFWFSVLCGLPGLHLQVATKYPWTWQIILPSVVRNVILPISMLRIRLVRRDGSFSISAKANSNMVISSPCLFQIIALLKLSNLNLFSVELCFIKLRIQAAQCNQLLMRASFNDLPSIHYQN